MLQAHPGVLDLKKGGRTENTHDLLRTPLPVNESIVKTRQEGQSYACA
jgi:hypothetical protein